MVYLQMIIICNKVPDFAFVVKGKEGLERPEAAGYLGQPCD
jgi:hypothetical protein